METSWTFVVVPETLHGRACVGDLLRASYRAERQGHPNHLATQIARRDPSLAGILTNRNRWFLNWKNQIGTSR